MVKHPRLSRQRWWPRHLDDRGLCVELDTDHRHQEADWEPPFTPLWLLVESALQCWEVHHLEDILEVDLPVFNHLGIMTVKTTELNKVHCAKRSNELKGHTEPTGEDGV